jgi:hypothetical protein
MRLAKVTILGLAAYGGYMLWNQYGDRVQELVKGIDTPPDRRVEGRSELTVTESAVGSDDPVAQARAILAESDSRSNSTRDTPGIERRTSQDTVET